jgi:ankyrin repeat protein
MSRISGTLAGLVAPDISGGKSRVALLRHAIARCGLAPGQTGGSLIKQGVNVNVRAGDGATALQWAAHWDDVVADLLIKANANINAADDTA